MFNGNLLDIVIPTNEDDLANLLLLHAYDWEPALAFLASVAKSRGIILNSQRVAEIIENSYEEAI